MHQIDDASRPLIVFEPFLLQPNPIPDYSPIELTIDTSPAIAGGILDVTYNIRNLSLAGNGTIQTAAVFFLVAGGANPETKILDFVDVEPLDAGTETGQRSFALNLPDETDPIWTGGLPGNYSIRMLVDATDSLAEFNETNNSRTASFSASPTVAIVSETGEGTEVAEGGAGDTFSLRLSQVPSSQVTFRVKPDTQIDLGAGAGTAIDLIFDATNALDPRSVSVAAVDDLIIEGPASAFIEFELIRGINRDSTSTRMAMSMASTTATSESTCSKPFPSDP
ncbi:MAG: CARDB domain-containing protein [Planctomycetota bacterium]